MIIMVPLIQLLLFGYAINTTPRHLPTAVLLQEQTDLGRTILKAMENTQYFTITRDRHDRRLNSTSCSNPERCCSASKFPSDFERALRRGDRPAMLVAADATDPMAAGTALSALEPDRADGVAERTRIARCRHAAVRNPHPCALQSGGDDRAQHRARPDRHHPHHDHADFHGAVGDARDRARHDGKPARDADHAGRDHDRQDRALYSGRLRAGRDSFSASAFCCSACRCSAA